ncbi:MAG TPA: 2Fe-2S iron-sulfur cluster binding domain-containing protein [Stellaceae bacterium]|nr:2Fe-2S iron-sulfur cluster binding domain-containing protein [Stellaceae bacterium]
MAPSDQDSDQGLDTFTVVLARSGREVQVAVGETILFALLCAGVSVEFSCEEGMCGACETKVLAGTPVHRGTVYPAAEHERRSTALICCAGSCSERLTLDL